MTAAAAAAVDEPPLVSASVSFKSLDSMGEGVVKADTDDKEAGDGVLLFCVRFFCVSLLEIAGVLRLLVTLKLAFKPLTGDEVELGCFRLISVADKLFVLLANRDLFELGSPVFDMRTLRPSSVIGFTFIGG